MSAPERRTAIPARPVIMILGGMLLSYAAFAMLSRGQADWFGGVSDAILLIASLAAAAALFYAALRSRSQGQRAFWAWGLLALAHLAFALGDLLWLVLQSAQGEPPFPSVADIFYLVYYPLFAAGLYLMAGERPSPEERLRNWIDLATVMLAGGLLLWNFLIAPLAAANPSDPLALALSAAYPILGLGLGLMLLRMLFRQEQQRPPQPLVLLEWGVVAVIVADLLFALQDLQGAYAAGGLPDFAYLAGYGLAALAGITQGRLLPPQETGEPPRRRFLWVAYLPYLMSILAFFLLVAHDQAKISFLALASGVGVILALTFLRQVISLRENSRLYEKEQHRRRLAEALGLAGQEVSGNLDFEAVPGLVLDQLATVLPYERCSIMIERDHMLVIAAQRGFPADERTNHLRISIRSDDVFLKMSQTHEPVVYPDVTQVMGWQLVPWLPLNKSWMGVPLIVREKAIGMLSITRRPADAFSPDDILLAVAFAGQAAIALQNARLYNELAEAYHNLEILDRTKSRFIEVVAHELRTPLTIIKGYSQALFADPTTRSNPQIGPYLDGILRGIDRMHETVNDMLAVTKIDAQELKVRRKPTLLSIVVGEAASKFEAAMQERNISLDAEGLKGLPPIEADSDLISKAFQHLVMNAIKYTPDGGHITITGALDEPGHAIEVVVSDTGIGIDPAQQQVIFEKFYQGGEVAQHSSGRTKFKGGGPGLGLAIARGIVVAHGGRIWVESPGCDEQTCPGSRFHVRLPLPAPTAEVSP